MPKVPQLIGIEKRVKLGFETVGTLDWHGVLNFETYPHNYIYKYHEPRKKQYLISPKLSISGYANHTR